MENLKKINRIYFESLNESYIKAAKLMAFVFVRSLNLGKLSTGEKLKRIYLEIDRLLKQKGAFDRPLYLLHANDRDALFDIFDSKNLFHHEEEEKKLEEALALNEKYHRLQFLILETEMQEQVENFETMELAAQRNGQELTAFQSLQKETLQLKMEYIKDHEYYQPAKRRSIKAVLPRPKKKLTFGYRGSEETLIHFYEEMNEAIHFVDKRTSMADFVCTLSSKDLKTDGKMMYMGCMTKQLKYIMEHSDDCFKSLKPSIIGRSQLFISKNGNLITAHNLEVTKCEKVAKKKAMDAILEKYKKKEKEGEGE